MTKVSGYIEMCLHQRTESQTLYNHLKASYKSLVWKMLCMDGSTHLGRENKQFIIFLFQIYFYILHTTYHNFPDVWHFKVVVLHLRHPVYATILWKTALLITLITEKKNRITIVKTKQTNNNKILIYFQRPLNNRSLTTSLNMKLLNYCLQQRTLLKVDYKNQMISTCVFKFKINCDLILYYKLQCLSKYLLTLHCVQLWD